MKDFFQNTFQNTPTPVIVCEQAEPHAIVFANVSARLLMNPLLTTDNLKENVDVVHLEDLLRFQRENQRMHLINALNLMGTIENIKVDVLTYQNIPLRLRVTANAVDMNGERYTVIYLHMEDESEHSAEDVSSQMSMAFHVANQSVRADDAINNVLAYVGSCVHVSRAYIFEEISADMTSNTYEWCAPGVTPAIQDLQSLKKEDYNYDVIIKNGMYITDDISGLPENDRAILEAQGIKSLAILPLIHADKPLGYIGFDDCEHTREWNAGEIRLLNNSASLIISLLVRRNSERNLSRSKEILQTVSDNIESVIYANDINTYEIVFLNNTLAKEIGRPVDALTGGLCWKHLQRGMDGPCEFCPIPKMLERGLLESGGSYTWEFQNTVNGKWYLVKDVFVKWIDGRDVHLETATEITHQKEYEEQLKYYASVDSLTGVYNREWGYRIMEELMRLPDTQENAVSLVFIDLDGLKKVNDTYGHDAGDRFISGVISVLQANKRKTDAICRWGGDEFVLLLRCDSAAAQRVMNNMEKKLAEYNQSCGEPFTLAYSYGITAFDRGPDASIGAIVARADRLMYADRALKKGVGRD